MYDRNKIAVGLVIGVVLLLYPFWPSAGKYATKAPEPQLTEQAKEAKECVADTSFMRRDHMKMLDLWRHEVVREGERYYTAKNGKVYYKSLQVTCMECHSNKSKFCDQCHNYLALAPYCWDCHVAPKENQ